MGRTKAHTVYKDRSGKRVPGVTTVIGVLEKPALIPWAWGLGMKGIDYRKFRDDKADIGTLTHEMILADLKEKECDTSDFTANQIDQAHICFKKYQDWKKKNTLEQIIIEKPIVSEEYRYGGTVDLYCVLNGTPTLIDYKTTKAVYDEMSIQLAAYKHLIEESYKYEVTECKILRIGRNEEEGFEERTFNNTGLSFKIFRNCLNIYKLKKLLKGA